jgi:hypothetical protein
MLRLAPVYASDVTELSRVVGISSVLRTEDRATKSTRSHSRVVP